MATALEPIVPHFRRVGHSKRTGWLLEAVADAPAILLTATPLQNSLFELWGLARFVDRTTTALGGFDEFVEAYDHDEKILALYLEQNPCQVRQWR